jgi:hypothetical protein
MNALDVSQIKMTLNIATEGIKKETPLALAVQAAVLIILK